MNPSFSDLNFNRTILNSSPFELDFRDSPSPPGLIPPPVIQNNSTYYLNGEQIDRLNRLVANNYYFLSSNPTDLSMPPLLITIQEMENWLKEVFLQENSNVFDGCLIKEATDHILSGVPVGKIDICYSVKNNGKNFFHILLKKLVEFVKKKLEAQNITFEDEKEFNEFIAVHYVTRDKVKPFLRWDEDRRVPVGVCVDFGVLRITLLYKNDIYSADSHVYHFPYNNWFIPLNKLQTTCLFYSNDNMDVNAVAFNLLHRRLALTNIFNGDNQFFYLAHKLTLGFETDPISHEAVFSHAMKFFTERYTTQMVENITRDFLNILKEFFPSEPSFPIIVNAEKYKPPSPEKMLEKLNKMREQALEESLATGERAVLGNLKKTKYYKFPSKVKQPPHSLKIDELPYSLKLQRIQLRINAIIKNYTKFSTEEPSKYQSQLIQKIEDAHKENYMGKSLFLLNILTLIVQIKDEDTRSDYCKNIVLAWKKQFPKNNLLGNFTELLCVYPGLLPDLLNMIKGITFLAWAAGGNHIEAYTSGFRENPETIRWHIGITNDHGTYYLSGLEDPVKMAIDFFESWKKLEEFFQNKNERQFFENLHLDTGANKKLTREESVIILLNAFDRDPLKSVVQHQFKGNLIPIGFCKLLEKEKFSAHNLKQIQLKIKQYELSTQLKEIDQFEGDEFKNIIKLALSISNKDQTKKFSMFNECNKLLESLKKLEAVITNVDKTNDKDKKLLEEKKELIKNSIISFIEHVVEAPSIIVFEQIIKIIIICNNLKILQSQDIEHSIILLLKNCDKLSFKLLDHRLFTRLNLLFIKIKLLKTDSSKVKTHLKDFQNKLFQKIRENEDTVVSLLPNVKESILESIKDSQEDSEAISDTEQIKFLISLTQHIKNQSLMIFVGKLAYEHFSKLLQDPKIIKKLKAFSENLIESSEKSESYFIGIKLFSRITSLSKKPGEITFIVNNLFEKFLKSLSNHEIVFSREKLKDFTLIIRGEKSLVSSEDLDNVSQILEKENIEQSYFEIISSLLYTLATIDPSESAKLLLKFTGNFNNISHIVWNLIAFVIKSNDVEKTNLANQLFEKVKDCETEGAFSWYKQKIIALDLLTATLKSLPNEKNKITSLLDFITQSITKGSEQLKYFEITGLKTIICQIIELEKLNSEVAEQITNCLTDALVNANILSQDKVNLLRNRLLNLSDSSEARLAEYLNFELITDLKIDQLIEKNLVINSQYNNCLKCFIKYLNEDYEKERAIALFHQLIEKLPGKQFINNKINESLFVEFLNVAIEKGVLQDLSKKKKETLLKKIAACENENVLLPIWTELTKNIDDTTTNWIVHLGIKPLYTNLIAKLFKELHSSNLTGLIALVKSFLMSNNSAKMVELLTQDYLLVDAYKNLEYFNTLLKFYLKYHNSITNFDNVKNLIQANYKSLLKLKNNSLQNDCGQLYSEIENNALLLLSKKLDFQNAITIAGIVEIGKIDITHEVFSSILTLLENPPLEKRTPALNISLISTYSWLRRMFINPVENESNILSFFQWIKKLITDNPMQKLIAKKSTLFFVDFLNANNHWDHLSKQLENEFISIFTHNDCTFISHFTKLDMKILNNAKLEEKILKKISIKIEKFLNAHQQISFNDLDEVNKYFNSFRKYSYIVSSYLPNFREKLKTAFECIFEKIFDPKNTTCDILNAFNNFYLIILSQNYNQKDSYLFEKKFFAKLCNYNISAAVLIHKAANVLEMCIKNQLDGFTEISKLIAHTHWALLMWLVNADNVESNDKLKYSMDIFYKLFNKLLTINSPELFSSIQPIFLDLFYYHNSLSSIESFINGSSLSSKHHSILQEILGTQTSKMNPKNILNKLQSNAANITETRKSTLISILDKIQNNPNNRFEIAHLISTITIFKSYNAQNKRLTTVHLNNLRIIFLNNFKIENYLYKLFLSLKKEAQVFLTTFILPSGSSNFKAFEDELLTEDNQKKMLELTDLNLPSFAGMNQESPLPMLPPFEAFGLDSGQLTAQSNSSLDANILSELIYRKNISSSAWQFKRMIEILGPLVEGPKETSCVMFETKDGIFIIILNFTNREINMTFERHLLIDGKYSLNYEGNKTTYTPDNCFTVAFELNGELYAIDWDEKDFEVKEPSIAMPQITSVNKIRKQPEQISNLIMLKEAQLFEAEAQRLVAKDQTEKANTQNSKK